MATILPFKGIRYNTSKIGSMADVVTPPFDVISESDLKLFNGRHPQNIVRLILDNGNSEDDHKHHKDWFSQASETFNTWRKNEFLIQDASPAYYLTTLDFSCGDKSMTRYGFICIIGLEPFEKKIILPHEKTYSKTKSERLELMKACHANFSPIFALYSDQHNQLIETLKASVSPQAPEMDFVDDQDQRHRLWRIVDPEIHRYVSTHMAEKRIFIADGHHRYETALNFRQWIRENGNNFSPTHPANYVMMYLSCMEDPGVIILPAHRVLRGIETSAVSSLIEKLQPLFDIKAIPCDDGDREKARAELISSLQSGTLKNAMGLFKKDHPAFYLLTLKPGIMKEKFGDILSTSLLDLDVMVLTNLILAEILGFNQAKLDDENLMSYSSSEKDAIDAVASKEWDMTFILNPTRVEQVRRIAEEGLIMPRKATYFFPKVITGLVLNDLRPGNNE